MTDSPVSPPAPPPAGWYPDPGAPGAIRWWDGTRWTEHASPLLPGRGPEPIGALATSLVVVLGVRLSIAVLFSVIFSLFVAGAIPEDTRDRSADGAASTTGYVFGVAIGYGLPLIVFILVAIWQFRLARVADPGQLRRGPRMHVASYLIPVVNLWFPLQNIRDLWRARIGPDVSGLVAWWWGLTIAEWIIFGALPRAGALADQIFLVYWLLLIPKTILTILLVLRLSRGRGVSAPAG